MKQILLLVHMCSTKVPTNIKILPPKFNMNTHLLLYYCLCHFTFLFKHKTHYFQQIKDLDTENTCKIVDAAN